MVGIAQVVRLPSLVPGGYALCQLLWVKVPQVPCPRAPVSLKL